MPEIECTDCNWVGKWEDLEIPEGCMVSVCPTCGGANIRDLDAITPDDYTEQNPQEVPRE